MTRSSTESFYESTSRSQLLQESAEEVLPEWHGQRVPISTPQFLQSQRTQFKVLTATSKFEILLRRLKGAWNNLMPVITLQLQIILQSVQDAQQRRATQPQHAHSYVSSAHRAEEACFSGGQTLQPYGLHDIHTCTSPSKKLSTTFNVSSQASHLFM